MPNKAKGLMEGQHALLILWIDRVRRNFPFETWEIKPNVTKHSDGIGGDDRDELSVTLNSYDLTGEMFNRDLEVLKAHAAAQAALDAATAPVDQQGAVRFKILDGTRQSFVLVDVCWDEFSLKQGGRANKMKTSVGLRFKYLKEAQSL